MNPAPERSSRQKTFVAFTLICIFVAVGYVVWAGGRPDPAARLPEPRLTPVATADRLTIQSQPHLVVINREAPHIDYVRLVSLDPTTPRIYQTTLQCDRMHYAAGQGICLRREVATESNPDAVRVTLFGADFQPRHTLTLQGFPTRARIAPDGRYAALTVFVTGHSYNDANMSTATLLLDTASGASLGNLEEFTVWYDGKQLQAPDFNFWGVTFAKDSDQFFATLRSLGVTYLVQGSVSARTLTVIGQGVECPSLSPDGARLVFKKLTPEGKWRLTVLNLATRQETPLAETESIDDQAEWLDDQHILYQSIDPDPPPWMSVLKVPADGSGVPEVLVPNAVSPAVVSQPAPVSVVVSWPRP